MHLSNDGSANFPDHFKERPEITSQNEVDLAQQWIEAAAAGDFASAWAVSDLLRSARIDYSGRERWCCPLWDGSPIDHRDVLIRCWRGLGDAIHFIRYAPFIGSRASSLTVEAPTALLPLFLTVQGIDRLVELDQGELEENRYVEIETTELPYVFRTTLDTIPCTTPYLDLPGHPEQSEKSELAIGLCWCGGPYDPRRSMHLFDLEPLSVLSEASFFQLQRGIAQREIFGAPFRFRNPSDCSMDVYSTAARIKSLDLVVSVDTMVAHLAGALGKKVYLLLPANADWRWLRNRDDSPWYPTMRLFRQSQPGDWAPVVTRLVESLT
jgi:hypothetical protein